MRTISRFFVFSFFLIATINAAAQKTPKTPLELNNYVVSINDSLYAAGKAWGTQFNKAVSSHDYASLIPFRQSMEQLIERKRNEVKKLNNVLGSKNLLDAMQSFLDFEAKMIADAFIPLEKLSAKSTEEEVKAAVNKLISLGTTENEEVKKLRVAQQEYASKNGFKIAGMD